MTTRHKKLGNGLSRRDFLKATAGVAGGVAASSLLPASMVAAQDSVTLDYWSVAWGGAAEVANSFAEAYQTAGGRPDVQINFSQFPGDRLPERVLLALLANGGPHFFNQNDVEWTKYTYTGAADPVPLDIFGVDSYDGLNQYYKPGIVELMQSASPDGQIRVLNETGTVYAFVYNATAFDDAGIPRPSPTEPMTWDEWGEAAAELTIWDGDRLVRSGYAARMEAPFWKEAFQNHFTTMVRQAGGDVLSADGKEATFTSDEAVAGFQHYVDFFKKYKTITPGFVTDPFGDFQAQRIVSLLSFPAFYATMLNRDLPFEVGVAPWPVVAGGKRITAGSFAGWIVNPNKPDEERAETWKFLAWMLMNPNDAMGVEVGKYGTAITWPNQWHDDFIASDDNWRPFYETQQYAVPALLHPRALEVKDQVMSAISNMIIGDDSVADALAGAKERVDAILAQPGI